jgi:hypothetical protein
VKARRPPPWDASGLVEKAWKRLEPPTRDQLAKRLGLKAPTNISKLNTGELPMTIEYAQRIVKAVPGLTLADLGAPSSVVAELDPTVLEHLEELATAVAVLTLKVDMGLENLGQRVVALETQAAHRDAAKPATSPRKRRAS